MAWILLVDDDHDGRCLAERRLEAAHHEVVAAYSAEEAFEIVAHRGAPGAAVLDVDLPGIDGLTLAPMLRERAGCEDLGVVFLSANVLRHQVAAGIALGGSYLTKPYAAIDLLHLVEDALAPSS